ncbi:MAG TPA: hypothetical protein VK041_05690 [Opitutales bacterium]|nr:hypothetical protein [Opitutales bacterium]
MEKPEGISIKRVLKSKRIRNVIYICIGLILLVVLYQVAQMARGAPVKEIIGEISELGAVPFFLAMAILPTFGFPVTPFYLLAGATFGIGVSLIATTLSQALNLILAYWLSRRYLRGPIEWMIRKTKYRIPEISSENFVKFAVLVRITPGPPNFVKSFILVFARIPFVPYFVVSLPITMGYAVGIIIFGDSVADGQPLQAVGGVLFLVLFMLVIKVIGNAISKRRELREAIEEIVPDEPEKE